MKVDLKYATLLFLYFLQCHYLNSFLDFLNINNNYYINLLLFVLKRTTGQE